MEIDASMPGKSAPEADCCAPFLSIREVNAESRHVQKHHQSTRRNRLKVQQRLSIYHFICSHLASLKLKEANMRRTILLGIYKNDPARSASQGVPQTING